MEKPSASAVSGSSEGDLLAIVLHLQTHRLSLRRCVYVAVCLSCRSYDGQVLVTLLDGTLLSLNRGTGLIAWTLDLGRPLLSGSGVWHEQPAARKDPLLRTILPGADGSLYIFTDAAGVQQSLEVLHETLSQHNPLCKCLCTCSNVPMH